MPLFGDPSARAASGNLTTPAPTAGIGSTVLLSVDVPANAVSAGQVFRLSLFGTSSSFGAVTFRVYAGPNGSTADALVWTSIASTGQASNQRAGFVGTLTVRSAGSGGTVQCECVGFAHTALLPTNVAAVTAPTVNTGNQWAITLAASCSTGTFTAQQAAVEAL